MSFLRHIIKKSRKLTGSSLYLSWFPPDIKEVIERLLPSDVCDFDISGLLSLVAIAGIDLNDDEFFKTQLIGKGYLGLDPKDNSNMFFDSQQNLSMLLFGITMDDVRKTLFRSTYAHLQTNQFIFLQHTRFLEKVREYCHNKKTLANSLFRRNSQKPNPNCLKWIRLLSIEVLFRVSMMFLKTNETKLKSQMAVQATKDGGDIVKVHSRKMEKLLTGMYPNKEGAKPKMLFEKSESWLGHDLLVKAIHTLSKSSTKCTVFAKKIPMVQWESFESEEEKKGRPKPNRESLFPTVPYPMKLTTCLAESRASLPAGYEIVKKTDWCDKRIRKRRILEVALTPEGSDEEFRPSKKPKLSDFKPAANRPRRTCNEPAPKDPDSETAKSLISLDADKSKKDSKKKRKSEGSLDSKKKKKTKAKKDSKKKRKSEGSLIEKKRKSKDSEKQVQTPLPVPPVSQRRRKSTTSVDSQNNQIPPLSNTLQEPAPVSKTPRKATNSVDSTRHQNTKTNQQSVGSLELNQKESKSTKPASSSNSTKTQKTSQIPTAPKKSKPVRPVEEKRKTKKDTHKSEPKKKKRESEKKKKKRQKQGTPKKTPQTLEVEESEKKTKKQPKEGTPKKTGSKLEIQDSGKPKIKQRNDVTSKTSVAKATTEPVSEAPKVKLHSKNKAEKPVVNEGTESQGEHEGNEQVPPPSWDDSD